MTDYRPDIDGLRAVAVLAVLLHHLSASLVPGGYVGVDVFFVISGYLITSIIRREMAEGRFTFRRFYQRRARRIFPALFVVLAVTLAAGYVLLLPSDYAAALRATLGTVFFASNFLFWREGMDYFGATEIRINPVLHTWSLAVEEQFYVFFPILLLACWRYLRKYTFWILLICAIVSLVGSALLVKDNRTAVFYVSSFRAWELLAGVLLAFGSAPRIRSRMIREVVMAAGLAAIVGACLVYRDSTIFPGPSALVPVLGAAAIIHFGTSGATLTGHLLQWRPIVYVGLISYSLYLWHWPLIVLAQYANGLDPPTAYAPVLFASSLLMASLSYHFIEKPFRRGLAVMPQLVFPATSAFVVLASVFCVVGLVRDGFPGRFVSSVANLDRARSTLIPYLQCGELSQQTPCFLGRAESQPELVLWGDSHLLSWAPALHQILLQERKRGVLLPVLGCAPVFEGGQSNKPACASENLAVKRYLEDHPEIKTIVVAAFWSTYFREDGPLTKIAQGGATLGGVAAAQRALRETIEWLHGSGRTVILIGPVPVYEKSVPAALALETVTGRSLLRSSASEQRRKNAPFMAVVDNFPASESFRYLDPIPWLCADECDVMKDGMLLYRDANHLTEEGAMALRMNLSKAWDLRAIRPSG